jgi:hypothetical protein
MDSDEKSIFIASLQGRTVECETVEDAVDVRRADALLHNGEFTPAKELRRLADVLARCGRHGESEMC